MKTSLIFFDTYSESIKGTKRGFIAFIFLMLFSYLWYCFYKSPSPTQSGRSNGGNFIRKTFILNLLLCSALGVQISSSPLNSMKYGLLVGLVVYGSHNSINLSENFSYHGGEIAILDTLYGAISTSIVAVILYHASGIL